MPAMNPVRAQLIKQGYLKPAPVVRKPRVVKPKKEESKDASKN
jgi:hypothetical protein